VEEILAKAVRQGKINHAWLLTGESAATRAQAMAFAQALLCQNPVNGEACGHCPACRKVKDGNHIDLQIVEPNTLRAKSVTIEQTRHMQQLASLQSYEGGRQVVLLLEAHTMQVAAANSLLKILEEPPEGLVFILTAINGDHLLPTILSRCTWVKVAAGEATSEEAVYQAALDAAHFLADLPHLSDSKLLLLADTWREDKTGLALFLNQLLIVVRDGILQQRLPQTAPLSTASIEDFPFAPCDGLTAASFVEEAQMQLRANVNSKLLFDVLLLKLGMLARKNRK